MPAYLLNGSELSASSGSYTVPANTYVQFRFSAASTLLSFEQLQDGSTVVFNVPSTTTTEGLMFACVRNANSYSLLFETEQIVLEPKPLRVVVEELAGMQTRILLFNDDDLIRWFTFDTAGLTLEVLSTQALQVQEEVLETLQIQKTNRTSFNNLSLTIAENNYADLILDRPEGTVMIELSAIEASYTHNVALVFDQSGIICYGEHSYAVLPAVSRSFRLLIQQINGADFLALYVGGYLALLEQLQTTATNYQAVVAYTSSANNTICVYKQGKVSSLNLTGLDLNLSGFVSAPANATLFRGLAERLTLASNWTQPVQLSVGTDQHQFQLTLAPLDGFVSINGSPTSAQAAITTRILVYTSNGKVYVRAGNTVLEVGQGRFITRLLTNSTATIMLPVGYRNSALLNIGEQLRLRNGPLYVFAVPEYSTASVNLQLGSSASIVQYATTPQIQQTTFPSNLLAFYTATELHAVTPFDAVYSASTGLRFSTENQFVTLASDQPLVLFPMQSVFAAVTNLFAPSLVVGARGVVTTTSTLQVGLQSAAVLTQTLQVGRRLTDNLSTQQTISTTLMNNVAIQVQTANSSRTLHFSTIQVATLFAVLPLNPADLQVGNTFSSRSRTELVVANALISNFTSCQVVANLRPQESVCVLVLGNARVYSDSTALQVASLVDSELPATLGVTNKVQRLVSQLKLGVRHKGRSPVLTARQMIGAALAVVDYILATVGLMSNAFSNKLPLILAEQAQKLRDLVPSPARHEHPNYVKRNEPANSAYKLGNSSDVCRRTHFHDQYVLNSDLYEVGNKKLYILDDAKTLNGKFRLELAQKQHGHNYERRRILQHEGQKINVASNASAYFLQKEDSAQLATPETLFAPAQHSHSDEYLKRGQAAKRARIIKNASATYGVGDDVMFKLAAADHKHEMYNLEKNRTKLASVNSVDNVKGFQFTIVRYSVPVYNISKTWVVNIRPNLHYLLKTRFPNEAIQSSTPLVPNASVPARFTLWSADALQLFVNGYTQNTFFDLRYTATSILAQWLRMLGINSDLISTVRVRIPIAQYHYAYFVQKQVISYSFGGQPYYVFLGAFAHYESISKFSSEFAVKFGTNYVYTLEITRLLAGLSPADPLPKTPNNLYGFGVSTMTPNTLEVICGGMPYNALVVTRKGAR